MEACEGRICRLNPTLLCIIQRLLENNHNKLLKKLIEPIAHLPTFSGFRAVKSVINIRPNFVVNYFCMMMLRDVLLQLVHNL